MDLLRIGDLNKLRRDALEDILKVYVQSYRRKRPKKEDKKLSMTIKNNINIADIYIVVLQRST